MRSLTENIRKAVIEMLILQLLSEGDMYGYQLTTEFKKRSNGRFIVKEGALYPILYRLNDAGHLSIYEEKTGIRRIIYYYHLEESGREHLHKLVEEYREFSRMVNFLLDSKEGAVYE